MNRNIAITAAVVIAFVIGTSIFVSSDIYQPISQDNSVKITMHKWPGYFHSFIAEEKRFFAEEGVNVELQLIENIDDNLQVFKDGKADAAFGLQSDAMLLAAEGVELKIVYITDFSNGGDVIVSKLDIKTIADLKGKTISVDKLNGFNHIFLVELLRINGLSESDVTVVPLIASEVPEALKDGRIDAGQTWEPYESQAIDDGYRKLASSAEVPGIITDVLMFHSKFVEERPDDVKKIIRAMDRALKYRNVDYIGSYGIMTAATGIPPSDLKRSIGGNIFPDLEENKESFTESEKLTSLYSSGRIISDFFLEKGVIEEPINLKDLLATEIIMELE